jgi:beta-hydroxylase
LTATASDPRVSRRARKVVMRSGKRLLRALSDFQGRHSTIGAAPVFDDPHAFPFTAPLEAGWREMRDELDAVMPDRARLPSFHDISPDQARISKGDEWKTFAFRAFRSRVECNCARCPRTAAILDGLEGLQNAFFSILSPGIHIPPHRGPTRALLRVHLPLLVPEPAEQCWLRVDDRVVHWEAGRVLVFDDTYEHEVRNDTDGFRVVLFMDFDRPMDRIGRLVNRGLIGLMKASPYVRDPLENLAKWEDEDARRDGSPGTR